MEFKYLFSVDSVALNSYRYDQVGLKDAIIIVGKEEAVCL
jgi:hypothetical protein